MAETKENKMDFERYHKIHIIGDEDNEGIFDNSEDEIIIEEKMDGANFRFMIKDGVVIFGSRTRELDEDNKNTKNFKRCIEYVREKIESIPREELRAKKDEQEG